MYFTKIYPKPELDVMDIQNDNDKKWIINEINIFNDLNFSESDIFDNFDINLQYEKYDLKTIQKNMKIDILEKEYINIMNNAYKKYYEDIQMDINLFYGINIESITNIYNLHKNYINCLYKRIFDKI